MSLLDSGNSDLDGNTDDSDQLAPIPWRMHLLIALVGLITIGVVGYGFHTGNRMNRVYAPLVDATMEIKLTATTAHLWFEEVISGDRHENIETVWNYLDQAEWYARAMLVGGQSPEGTYIPIPDAKMQQEIKAVQKKLVKFKDITKQRLAARETAGIGTDIDQEYDAVFKDFINQADKVESRLQQVMVQDLRNFRTSQSIIIVICISLFFIVGIFLHRFDRAQARDFLTIQKTNKDLEKEIVERLRIEAEREMLIDELQAKNAELERFTYTVSHDLKSPLVTIKGFLGMLEQDIQSGDQELIKDDMDEIRNASDKMKKLLDELLELSRIGRIMNPSEDVSLADLAQGATRLLAGPIADRGVRVDISPDLPVVYGDRPRLLEVMQNLIDNAVKYMGEQPNPRIEIGMRQDGAETVCYVKDNGIGVEPRYQDKIFALFEQLDQDFSGTGIGLAIVKRVVEVHNGRVWVESEGIGKGSTFFFTLPNRDESLKS